MASQIENALGSAGGLLEQLTGRLDAPRDLHPGAAAAGRAGGLGHALVLCLDAQPARWRHAEPGGEAE